MVRLVVGGSGQRAVILGSERIHEEHSMKNRIRLVLAAALALAAASGSWAAGEKAAALTSGEIRKVDVKQQKVTIKHEAIANLDMGPMTMVFRASKPEQLKDLKAGDKVRFRAESSKGALVVTHIEAAK
jgi:Cu(I)/Ag(I) efflux system periplasmic protein CusF